MKINMAYNQQYYSDRKKELTEQFESEKNRAFNRIVLAVNEFQIESQKIQTKFKQIEEQEKESQEKPIGKSVQDILKRGKEKEE